jgi:hypothetical protein
MALVLSLTQGQDFYVGIERFVVVDVLSQSSLLLRRDRTGQFYKITSTRATEIMEDVFVSVGDRQSSAGTIRVAIDAHPDLLVLRGDKPPKLRPGPS